MTTAKGPLPYAVGLVNAAPGQSSIIKCFATESLAAAFIATLPGHETGRYYLDGPDTPKRWTFSPCQKDQHHDCVGRIDLEPGEVNPLGPDVSVRCNCRCHLERFVDMIAGLLLDGEESEAGEPFEMEGDDACETVSSIIGYARRLTID